MRSRVKTERRTPQVANASFLETARRGDGQPLPMALRETLEPRFGHSFANVRVFDDTHAQSAAAALHAKAFTVGEDIAFSAGRYAPLEPEGQRLLMHELSHTLQQRRVAKGSSLEISWRGDALEQNADSAVRDVQSGVQPSFSSAAPSVQLEAEDEVNASPASVEPGVSYPGDTEIEAPPQAISDGGFTPNPQPSITRTDTPNGSFDVYSDDYPISLGANAYDSPAWAVKRAQLGQIDNNLMNIDAGGGGINVQGGDAFKGQVNHDLAYLMTSPVGASLVEDIASTDQQMNIMHADPRDPDRGLRSNSEIARVEEDGQYAPNGERGAGTDVGVYYDPERSRIFGEDLPNAPWNDRAAPIGLGHEMIHGLYDMRGTTAPGTEPGVINARGESVSVARAELQAVGLGFSGQGDQQYSENDLREQLGEPRREH